jgi:hypothetical protein
LTGGDGAPSDQGHQLAREGIASNRACYCPELGRLEECKKWFKMAMNIDEKTVRLESIDDPDLQGLWDSMNGTS